MMEIKFRQIYSEPREGDFINSIIAFNKIKHIVKEYPRDYLRCSTCSDQYWNEHYVAQYKKRLIIDLWILVLRFEWLTKEITL
jgi:hypothetical protein